MKRIRASFIAGNLSSALTNSDTTMVSNDLVAFPVVTSPDEYAAIIIDPEATLGVPEIVWVTAHAASATSATIVRNPADEDTAARAHNNGTYWIHGPTERDWELASMIVNTDGDPGHNIYVGAVDPQVDYSADLQVGDIWIKV